MRKLFLAAKDAAELIGSGAVVFVAGPEALLDTLPRGRWVGGTTAYFATREGTVSRSDRLFCTVFDEALDARTSLVLADDLATLVSNRFDKGFACIVAPAFSRVHERYAVDGPAVPGLFDQPVFGWVAGVPLDQVASVPPKVYDGKTGTAHLDGLATLWVWVSAATEVDLDIVNIHSQGGGDTIVFPRTGFEVTDCLIGGNRFNFAAYVLAEGIDTRLPLIADYAGAFTSVAFQGIDAGKGEVRFYAPVIAGTEYRLAGPIGSRAGAYDRERKSGAAIQVLSCNCVLNDLDADPDGNGAAEDVVGPVTFGEFAYILSNQTLARLVLRESPRGASNLDLRPARRSQTRRGSGDVVA